MTRQEVKQNKTFGNSKEPLFLCWPRKTDLSVASLKGDQYYHTSTVVGPEWGDSRGYWWHLRQGLLR